MHTIRLTVSDGELNFLKRLTDNIEEIINLHRMKPPDWDHVLIEIQESKDISPLELVDIMRWFYQEGLFNLILDKFPIKHNRGIEIKFISFEWREPDYTFSDCRELGLTYAYSLYGKARLYLANTGEIKEQDLYLVDIPMITPSGTFIIDGIEKTLVMDSPVTESLINRSINGSLVSESLDELASTSMQRMRRISLSSVTPSRLIDIHPFANGINGFFDKIATPIS